MEVRDKLHTNKKSIVHETPALIKTPFEHSPPIPANFLGDQ